MISFLNVRRRNGGVHIIGNKYKHISFHANYKGVQYAGPIGIIRYFLGISKELLVVTDGSSMSMFPIDITFIFIQDVVNFYFFIITCHFYLLFVFLCKRTYLCGFWFGGISHGVAEIYAKCTNEESVMRYPTKRKVGIRALTETCSCKNWEHKWTGLVANSS